MNQQFPVEGEYNPYYWPYISLCDNTLTIVENLQQDLKVQRGFLQKLPVDKADFAYATGKWTVKQVLAHINDTERVFAYRALAFARGDQNSLPGFDQDLYVDEADLSHLSLADLAHSFQTIRANTIDLFQQLPESAFHRTGVANGNKMSVRAVGWIVVGHAAHHARILKERYL